MYHDVEAYILRILIGILRGLLVYKDVEYHFRSYLLVFAFGLLLVFCLTYNSVFSIFDRTQGGF
jgi:hypothetical protein